MAKGIAIIGMVMIHLFCRSGELPYSPLIGVGKPPLIYYFGLLGDMCVPVFCFCSGYAHFLLSELCKKVTLNVKMLGNTAFMHCVSVTWVTL